MDTFTEQLHKADSLKAKITLLTKQVKVEESYYQACLKIYKKPSIHKTIDPELVSHLAMILFALGHLLNKEEAIGINELPVACAQTYTDDQATHDLVRYLYAVGYLYSNQVEKAFNPLC